jgi:hypothetical protein
LLLATHPARYVGKNGNDSTSINARINKTNIDIAKYFKSTKLCFSRLSISGTFIFQMDVDTKIKTIVANVNIRTGIETIFESKKVLGIKQKMPR